MTVESKKLYTWKDYYKACKYYLSYPHFEEKEVSLEEFVQAERSAGFRRKVDNNQSLPATGGFGGYGIVDGRVETTPEALEMLKNMDWDS